MRSNYLLAAIICLLFAATMPAQRTRPTATPTPAAQPPEVSYTVSMSKPATHLLEVEMRVKWPQMPDKTDLKLPVWTPGSYLIREYARHVQDFAAQDSAGAPLTWRKTSKNTWQVDSKGKNEFVASYKVYSNELTVRTNELNHEHAFWNNSALLFWVKGHLNIPSTVKVVPHANWRVATGLPPVEGSANTFRAADYDVLYDAPFEVSDFKETTFDYQGKKHRIVVTGDGNYDLARLAADTTKIVDETVKIFSGDIPYQDYTFIVNTRGGGGLEHLNSTALQSNRFGFRPDSRYRNFLALVAHEFFHAYNVKRMRPDALGPFDYETENYTKLLWVAEGATEYYSNILMRRAGFISDREFLSQRATGIRQLQERPGRFETSLEESSWDAWIKYYRQDENAINNQISYYDKGEIVSMMLDIAIRTASNGAKSLDDVMRHLYAEFYKKNKNFTPEDYQKVSEQMAGKSLDDFFAKYVRGRAEIDYNAILSPIGLHMRVTTSTNTRPHLGAETSDTLRGINTMGMDVADETGKYVIKTVLAGSAAHDGGLNTADQVLAIDGYRVTSLAFINTYLNERKAGDKVRWSVFRFDKLMDIEAAVGVNARKDYAFAPVEAPTEDQRRLYRAYMNADL
jgi:predicted metalloprotease with PDZ domain